MKKILSLLSGLTLVTPLSVNLYSCNSSEKEDLKVSQQKVDELVDLFNYYNKHNDDPATGSPSMIWFNLDPNQKELFKKYEELELDKVYRLSLSQILLNSIFFNARDSVDVHLLMFDKNGEYDKKKIEEELIKFNFLKLNLQESKKTDIFPVSAGKAIYWEQVWNNPQVKIIADDENILDKIIDENKGHNPNFEVINLKLQYIQRDGIVITSSKYFEVQIDNKY